MGYGSDDDNWGDSNSGYSSYPVSDHRRVRFANIDDRPRRRFNRPRFRLPSPITRENFYSLKEALWFRKAKEADFTAFTYLLHLNYFILNTAFLVIGLTYALPAVWIMAAVSLLGQLLHHSYKSSKNPNKPSKFGLSLLVAIFAMGFANLWLIPVALPFALHTILIATFVMQIGALSPLLLVELGKKVGHEVAENGRDEKTFWQHTRLLMAFASGLSLMVVAFTATGPLMPILYLVATAGIVTPLAKVLVDSQRWQRFYQRVMGKAETDADTMAAYSVEEPMSSTSAATRTVSGGESYYCFKVGRSVGLPSSYTYYYKYGGNIYWKEEGSKEELWKLATPAQKQFFNELDQEEESMQWTTQQITIPVTTENAEPSLSSTEQKAKPIVRYTVASVNWLGNVLKQNSFAGLLIGLAVLTTGWTVMAIPMIAAATGLLVAETVFKPLFAQKVAAQVKLGQIPRLTDTSHDSVNPFESSVYLDEIPATEIKPQPIGRVAGQLGLAVSALIMMASLPQLQLVLGLTAATLTFNGLAAWVTKHPRWLAFVAPKASLPTLDEEDESSHLELSHSYSSTTLHDSSEDEPLTQSTQPASKGSRGKRVLDRLVQGLGSYIGLAWMMTLVLLPTASLMIILPMLAVATTATLWQFVWMPLVKNNWLVAAIENNGEITEGLYAHLVTHKLRHWLSWGNPLQKVIDRDLPHYLVALSLGLAAVIIGLGLSGVAQAAVLAAGVALSANVLASMLARDGTRWDDYLGILSNKTGRLRVAQYRLFLGINSLLKSIGNNGIPLMAVGATLLFTGVAGVAAITAWSLLAAGGAYFVVRQVLLPLAENDKWLKADIEDDATITDGLYAFIITEKIYNKTPSDSISERLTDHSRPHYLVGALFSIAAIIVSFGLSAAVALPVLLAGVGLTANILATMFVRGEKWTDYLGSVKQKSGTARSRDMRQAARHMQYGLLQGFDWLLNTIGSNGMPLAVVGAGMLLLGGVTGAAAIVAWSMLAVGSAYVVSQRILQLALKHTKAYRETDDIFPRAQLGITFLGLTGLVLTFGIVPAAFQLVGFAAAGGLVIASLSTQVFVIYTESKSKWGDRFAIASAPVTAFSSSIAFIAMFIAGAAIASGFAWGLPLMAAGAGLMVLERPALMSLGNKPMQRVTAAKTRWFLIAASVATMVAIPLVPVFLQPVLWAATVAIVVGNLATMAAQSVKWLGYADRAFSFTDGWARREVDINSTKDLKIKGWAQPIDWLLNTLGSFGSLATATGVGLMLAGFPALGLAFVAGGMGYLFQDRVLQLAFKLPHHMIVEKVEKFRFDAPRLVRNLGVGLFTVGVLAMLAANALPGIGAIATLVNFGMAFDITVAGLVMTGVGYYKAWQAKQWHKANMAQMKQFAESRTGLSKGIDNDSAMQEDLQYELDSNGSQKFNTGSLSALHQPLQPPESLIPPSSTVDPNLVETGSQSSNTTHSSPLGDTALMSPSEIILSDPAIDLENSSAHSSPLPPPEAIPPNSAIDFENSSTHSNDSSSSGSSVGSWLSAT